jgi:Spy/CpxP family protein refolding chaperone
MTTDTGAPQPASTRRLRMFLMASLAFNVLIVGSVAGALLFGRHHGWKQGHHRKGFALSSFTQTLPAERSDALRQFIEGEEATLAALRKAKFTARNNARAILSTEPFDPVKFRAALDESVQADQAEKKARSALLAQTAEKLTPDERHQLHQWFERRRARYKRWRERMKK